MTLCRCWPTSPTSRPELKRWLHKFQQDGVPLTVIFPADRQNDPIVLSGLYSQGTLLGEASRRRWPRGTTHVPTT